MRNSKNQIEFNQDKKLFITEPTVKATYSWRKLADVPDKEKAIILFFEALAGKRLYFSVIEKDKDAYAKLYIVDNKDIHILFVECFALEPVERYHNVAEKK